MVFAVCYLRFGIKRNRKRSQNTISHKYVARQMTLERVLWIHLQTYTHRHTDIIRNTRTKADWAQIPNKFISKWKTAQKMTSFWCFHFRWTWLFTDSVQLGDESRTQTFLFGRHVSVWFSVNIRHTLTTWYEQMGRKWEQNETHIYTHTLIAQNYQLNKSFLSTIKCCFAMLFVIWFCFVDHTFQTWNFHIQTMVAGCWFCAFLLARSLTFARPFVAPFRFASISYHIFI